MNILLIRRNEFEEMCRKDESCWKDCDDQKEIIQSEEKELSHLVKIEFKEMSGEVQRNVDMSPMLH
jgi:hypothetical protein